MQRFTPLLLVVHIACFASCTGKAGKPLAISATLPYMLNIPTQTAQIASSCAGTLYPVGDLNGDGKKDTAFVIFQEDSLQYANISFSCPLPALQFEGYDGTVADVGDLDGNGTDEFVYNRVWFQGNHSTLYVYGYRNGNWQLFGEGAIWLDRMWHETDDPVRYLQSRIKKIDKRHFYINTLTHTDSDVNVDTMQVVTIPR